MPQPINMHDLIIKIGRFKTTLLFTLFSVIASLLITMVIVKFSTQHLTAINILASIFTPAVIAPPIVWYIVGLLLKVDQLEKGQRRLATYDELTGLMARRAFLENNNNLLNLISRNKSVFSLGYLDIDNFKNINDKYGHAGGDTVLKSFSSCLKNNLRKSDLAGRIGGEEFAIALPNTELEDAIKLLNDIRLILKNNPVDFDGKTIHFTVSIGVTLFDKDNLVNFDELTKQADSALYRAKNSGKNCVIQYLQKCTNAYVS